MTLTLTRADSTKLTPKYLGSPRALLSMVPTTHSTYTTECAGQVMKNLSPTHDYGSGLFFNGWNLIWEWSLILPSSSWLRQKSFYSILYLQNIMVCHSPERPETSFSPETKERLKRLQTGFSATRCYLVCGASVDTLVPQKKPITYESPTGSSQKNVGTLRKPILARPQRLFCDPREEKRG
jgi:hypothetical protein